MPLAALGRENKDVIGNYRELLKGALWERLTLLCDPVKGKRGSDALASNLADAVRIFIKQEPHKLAKIEAGRLRIIASVSLLDSLVERCLYQRRAKREISRWAEIPSKPGMGASDENIQVLADEIDKMVADLGCDLDSDVAGWDWQLKWWCFLAALFVDMHLLGVVANSDYFNAMVARELAAMYPVLCDSKGSLYELVEAIMGSGRFVTSYKNSRKRTLLSSIAGTKCICMGDDCNEAPLPGVSIESVRLSYKSMGYSDSCFEVTKNVSLEGTIFCSLRFYYRKDGTISAEPVRWIRSLYRLLSKPFTVADLAQFEHEVRNCREYLERPALRKLLTESAVARVGAPQILQ